MQLFVCIGPFCDHGQCNKLKLEHLSDHVEEAVNEVKRQAMDEVQKAVAEAEQKAFEMIAAERAKMEKTLAEAKRKAQEDAIMIINEQEDSSEVSTHIHTGWCRLKRM